MKYVLTTVALVAAIVAGVASANGSPYSPGLVYGWNGVGAGDGVRYVAFGMPKSTIVAAVRARDGRVLRSNVVRGEYGVPLVAYNGTSGGLSGDRKSLVLGSYGTPAWAVREDALRRPRHEDPRSASRDRARRILVVRRRLTQRHNSLLHRAPARR